MRLVVSLFVLVVLTDCKGRGGGFGGGRGFSSARSGVRAGTSGKAGGGRGWGIGGSRSAGRTYTPIRGSPTAYNRGFASSGVGSASSATRFRSEFASSRGVGGMAAAYPHITVYPHTSIFLLSHHYYFGTVYHPKPNHRMCRIDVGMIEKGFNTTATTSNATVVDVSNSTISDDSNSTLVEDLRSDAIKVTFPNGTRPEYMMWPCPVTHECCGVECCEIEDRGYNYVGATLVIFAAIGLFLICTCQAKSADRAELLHARRHARTEGLLNTPDSEMVFLPKNHSRPVQL